MNALKNLFQPTWLSLALVIGLITAIWSLSSVGYFVLVDLLEKPGGYNEGPRLFSLYYAAWCILAVVVFHPGLSTWGKLTFPAEDRTAIVLMIAVCALFAFGILPFLPSAVIPPDISVSEIIVAEPWYFLPKSIEIYLQQILMAALVVSLAAQKLKPRQIAVVTAVVFGGFHLTLVLNGAHPFYVLRYTVGATLFGAVTPYLMLKMRNGFVYSFLLHWGWYALDTTIWRFYFSGM